MIPTIITAIDLIFSFPGKLITLASAGMKKATIPRMTRKIPRSATYGSILITDCVCIYPLNMLLSFQ